MAVTKTVSETSLSIEIQKGTDKSGNPTFTKKTFSNLRNDVNEQNAYDLAEAIKAVIEASTRSTSLIVSSKLINA